MCWNKSIGNYQTGEHILLNLENYQTEEPSFVESIQFGERLWRGGVETNVLEEKLRVMFSKVLALEGLKS